MIIIFFFKVAKYEDIRMLTNLSGLWEQVERPRCKLLQKIRVLFYSKPTTKWQEKNIKTATSIQGKKKTMQQQKSTDTTMNLSINRGIEPTGAKRDENYLNRREGEHSWEQWRAGQTRRHRWFTWLGPGNTRPDKNGALMNWFLSETIISIKVSKCKNLVSSLQYQHHLCLSAQLHHWLTSATLKKLFLELFNKVVCLCVLGRRRLKSVNTTRGCEGWISLMHHCPLASYCEWMKSFLSAHLIKCQLHTKKPWTYMWDSLQKVKPPQVVSTGCTFSTMKTSVVISEWVTLL